MSPGVRQALAQLLLAVSVASGFHLALMILGSTFAASRFPSRFCILWEVFGVLPEPHSCVDIIPFSMASLQAHPLLPATLLCFLLSTTLGVRSV